MQAVGYLEESCLEILSRLENNPYSMRSTIPMAFNKLCNNSRKKNIFGTVSVSWWALSEPDTSAN